MSRIMIAPSILSADFGRLAEAIELVEAAGADVIHVDVMDGHFVPNLTIGAPMVSALKEAATVPLDVHLMIDNADDTLDWYLDAGADWVTVHVEAVTHLHRVVSAIHDAGARAGVSLNPSTPVHALTDIIRDLDLALVMSVNPGFGGQQFIPHALDKTRQLAELARRENPELLIQIDGGINSRNAGDAAHAGARCFVAGNAIFGSSDPVASILQIRTAAERALAV
jgi:ribulose-phosphate 3-epimerase